MKSTQLLSLGLSITLLVAVGLACGQGPAEESQQQIATVFQLSQSADRVRNSMQETSKEFSDLEERLVNLEDSVVDFTEAAWMHTLDRTVGIPDPPTGKVAVRLRFPTLPEPLPGEGIELFETTSGVSTIWAMESLEKGQPLPIGPSIEEGALFLAPGQSKMVTVAYTNPTSQEVGFLVLPHQESPGNLARHFWPTCLCMSMTYKAPAEGSWYRVIRVAVGPDIPPGSKVDSIWPVLTDPSVFPAMAMREPTEPAATADLTASVKSLAGRNGCLACHSVDGSPTQGPTWNGLFGKEETLADGSKVTVDETYLHESIVDPEAKIVMGFPPGIMPSGFGDKLSSDDIQAIIEYIKALK